VFLWRKSSGIRFNSEKNREHARLLPPEAFIPGYALYFLFIFLPGFGFGELLEVTKRVKSLSEKFAIAFGLGISIDTLVMLVKTSGIGGLVGVTLTTVYFVIVLGAIALAVSAALNNWNLSLFAKPTRMDISLFLLILAQSGILLLYFQKYPIFPEYQSPDFINHVNYVDGLISGTTRSIPQGLLYFGVHYQLASSLILVGGEPLVTIQRTMALLMILAPLLFYLAGKKLFFDSSLAGFISALVYVVTGSIWFRGPLDSGLYPNFFGIVAALFFLIALIFVISYPRSIQIWMLFTLALINIYMSHYTAVTLLPAIVLLPLIQYIVAMSIKGKAEKQIALRDLVKNYLPPVIVAIIPVIVPFIIYPNIGNYILFLAQSGGGSLTGGTLLSNALSATPFLKYMVMLLADDIEFIALVILVVVFLYKGFTSKSSYLFIPLIWFIALAVTSPQNVSAWRFSYEALVPLALMASCGIFSLVNLIMTTRSKVSISGRVGSKGGRGANPADLRAMIVVVLIIIFGALIVGAYGESVVIDAVNQTSTSAQSQNYVYNAIYWLGNNTPNGSTYLSVSDYRFTYSAAIINRTTFYSYIYSPDTALGAAKNASIEYIIVTYDITASVPNYSEFYPWNNFPSSSNSNFTLIYSDPDVRIYQIAPNAG
jgi:hypothetical protein